MATGQRKKKLWAIKRAENAAKREAEIEANTAKKRPKKQFTELRPRDSKYVITDAMQRTASAPSATAPVRSPICKSKTKEVTPEWAAREEAARLEIQRKKGRLAPLYNKGGYQYIDPDAPAEIIKNLGKKV